MERLALNEEEKLKKILDLKTHLNFKQGKKNSKINERLVEKGSRIFTEDDLYNKDSKGIPTVGQIVVGIKFWHYQRHIGIITKVKGRGFDYADLTESHNQKSIALKWRREVSEEQIKLINRELDLAIEILQNYVEESERQKREMEEKISKKNDEELAKALELL